MKKERLLLLSTFMPPLCMGMLMGFEYLFTSGKLPSEPLYAMLAELAAFLLPFGILFLLTRFISEKEKPALRLGRKLPYASAFTLFAAAAVPPGAFLLNVIQTRVSGPGSLAATEAIYANGEKAELWLLLAAFALVPALVEELFFRGGLFGMYEQNGTMPALLLCAVSFALVHGSAGHFLAPLFAGFVYGYLTYALRSIWPAVFAHLLNNVYALSVARLSAAYEALGLWPYFILFNVFCFFIFLYLSMRSLEKLLERGRVPKFQKAAWGKAAVSTLFSPGFLLLVLMFAMKALY